MTKAKERESKSEGAGAAAEEVESLLTSAEIKSIRDELERERELRLRALADFDNYRKRLERERQQFDPMRHEAVGAIKAGASKTGIVLEPGAVTDETRRGYLWDGEVLRPARVHVAK